MGFRFSLFMFGFTVLSFLIVDKSDAKEVWKERLITSAEIMKDPTRVPITINFETGKAKILPHYHKQLAHLADAILKLSHLSFEIGGHTDQRGNAEFNQRLSERRADSVRDFLISSHGIPGDRLLSRGYGEARLLTPEHDAASWAKNRRVEIVALSTKTALPLLQLNPIGHTGKINDLEFSTNNILYTAGNDGTIQAWDYKNGTRVGVFRGEITKDDVKYRTMAISPSGKTLVAAGDFPGDQPIKKNAIRIFDTDSRRLVRLIQGPTSPVLSLKFSKDGRTFYGSSGSFVYFWNAISFEFIYRYKINSDQITRISPSPDSSSLIIGTRKGQVVSLFANNNKFSQQKLYKHPGPIISIDWHPSGKFFGTASLDGSIVLFQLAGAKKVVSISPKSGPERMTGIVFSPNDNWFATVSSLGGVKKYQLSGNSIAELPPGKRQYFYHLAVSGDGKHIATISELTNKILILSTSDLSVIKEIDNGTRFIQFVANGRKPGEILFGEDLAQGLASKDVSISEEIELNEYAQFSQAGVLIGDTGMPVTKKIKRHDLVRGDFSVTVTQEQYGEAGDSC